MVMHKCLLYMLVLWIASELRLAYFFSTDSKVRILENVSTGEIGAMTKEIHKEDWHVRSVMTNPADACPTSYCHDMYSIQYPYCKQKPTVVTCPTRLPIVQTLLLRMWVSHALLASESGTFLCRRSGVTLSGTRWKCTLS